MLDEEVDTCNDERQVVSIAGTNGVGARCYVMENV